MNIVVLDGYALNPGDLSWQGFHDLGTCVVYGRTPAEEIVARIGEAEAVIINKTPMTESVLDACPSIRYIGVLATGYNVVDIAAAKARGIVVTNIPTYGTAAVAQMTFALLLELCHHVGSHSDSVHAGEWQQSIDFSYWKYPLLELDGLTMGLVGLGRIGLSVVRIARAFGLSVLAYDPAIETAPEGITLTSLNALLAESDVVSLHCPLLPSTMGLMDAARIERMKDGALLINTARGQLLNEADVAEALRSGKLGGLAVDVASVEPIRADNPLLGAPNCIITPHIAWAPLAARQRLMRIACENLRAFLMGRPVNRVS